MSNSRPVVFPVLTRVFEVLSQQKCHAYVVGGFVRDWILGREIKDIDISIGGDALDLAEILANRLDARYIVLDEINRIGRITSFPQNPQLQMDISGYKQTIEDDLVTRDFTIDAMAIDLQNFIDGSYVIVDPFNGQDDIKACLVRAVREDVFNIDPMRLLRAVRLAAQLSFTIEQQTEKLIKKNVKEVTRIAGERVRDELLRLLALHNFNIWLRYMDELGLLLEIMPELGEMKGVEQPKEHYWDVYTHSVETVAAVEFLIHEAEWVHGDSTLLASALWSDEIQKHLDEQVSSGSQRKHMLKIGALLHDIAKPAVKAFDANGRMRFIGHTRQGAAVAAAILNRLRFSSREIDLVEKLVYHHLRPVQLSNTGLPTGKAIYRFFRDTGDAGIDILMLALADFLATQGPRLDVDEWKQQNELMQYIIDEQQRQETKLKPARLINGHEIMSLFNLTSGPLVGKLLSLVHEAQAIGEISSKDEAIALIRSELESENCNGNGCASSTPGDNTTVVHFLE
jgi:poly(A) polymerase